MYEMLSGELHFIADTAMEVIFRHTRDPVPSVLSVKNDLPADVDKVLQMVMAKAPEERFESCCKFSSALTDALGGKVANRPSKIQAAAEESQLLIVQKREQQAEVIN